MYPRDRVVLNQIGADLVSEARICGRGRSALRPRELVDPEDVQMHYTLMLCYRGLGDREKAAARREAVPRASRPTNPSQAITAKPRLLSPEDNNERQTIHDHESVRSDDNR